jgi:hypothetical protein
MYLAHYILPFAIYYFFRSKVMLGGLLIGNLIDLDHILLRIFGIVPWFQNICGTDYFWKCNGFFGYPLHSVYVLVSLIVTSIVLFFLMNEEKELKINKWMFWICIGALLNLSLDFVQLLTGVGFVVSG